MEPGRIVEFVGGPFDGGARFTPLTTFVLEAEMPSGRIAVYEVIGDRALHRGYQVAKAGEST